MPKANVTVSHPELGTAKVTPHRAKHLVERGWTVVEVPNASTAEPADQPEYTPYRLDGDNDSDLAPVVESSQEPAGSEEE